MFQPLDADVPVIVCAAVSPTAPRRAGGCGRDTPAARGSRRRTPLRRVPRRPRQAQAIRRCLKTRPVGLCGLVSTNSAPGAVPRRSPVQSSPYRSPSTASARVINSRPIAPARSGTACTPASAAPPAHGSVRWSITMRSAATTDATGCTSSRVDLPAVPRLPVAVAGRLRRLEVRGQVAGHPAGRPPRAARGDGRRERQVHLGHPGADDPGLSARPFERPPSAQVGLGLRVGPGRDIHRTTVRPAAAPTSPPATSVWARQSLGAASLSTGSHPTGRRPARATPARAPSAGGCWAVRGVHRPTGGRHNDRHVRALRRAPARRPSALGEIHPTREEFRELASDRRVIPVTRRLLADALTPVGALRHAGRRPARHVPAGVRGERPLLVAVVVRRGVRAVRADRTGRRRALAGRGAGRPAHRRRPAAGARRDPAAAAHRPACTGCRR